MNGFHSRKNLSKLVILLGVITIVLTSMSGVAQAGEVSGSWAPCHEAPGGTDDSEIDGHSGGNHRGLGPSGAGPVNQQHASVTTQTMFNVLRVLGPLLGTVIFIVLLATSAITAAGDGGSKLGDGKKALGYGFAVPIAVALLEVLLNDALLSDKMLGCYFP